ncbi:hypothetical protein SteCoe_13667 [Stentor coeruleus]|uniref:Uncharacterized protein n=1 Tax=Stentor coeruleus TaxID=5963 RepID=A0A1R2C7W5_9CILI|nr:hypothetical protein SteCoe_13667 [Stentor coeruleus]
MHSTSKTPKIPMKSLEKPLRNPRTFSNPEIFDKNPPDKIINTPQGYVFEDTIRTLEEKVRRAEIANAELDLKITKISKKDQQAEKTKESSGITKILYQENRELKKHIKGLSEELKLFRVERRRNLSTQKEEEEDEEKNDIKKQLKEEKDNKDKIMIKNKELKTIINRQKVKFNKKLATMIIFKTISHCLNNRYTGIWPILKPDITSIDYKLKDKIFLSLVKRKIQNQKNVRKILAITWWKRKVALEKSVFEKIIRIFEVKNLRNLKSKWLKWDKCVSSLKYKGKILRKIGENMCRIKINQVFFRIMRVSQIFSLKKCRLHIRSLSNQTEVQEKILNSEKILTNRLMISLFVTKIRKIVNNKVTIFIKSAFGLAKDIEKTIRFVVKSLSSKCFKEKLIVFNIWKHKVAEMNINDLCVLHQQQNIEKNVIIEQFTQFHKEECAVNHRNVQILSLKYLFSIVENRFTKTKSLKFLAWKTYTKAYIEKSQKVHHSIDILTRNTLKKQSLVLRQILAYSILSTNYIKYTNAISKKHEYRLLHKSFMKLQIFASKTSKTRVSLRFLILKKYKIYLFLSFSLLKSRIQDYKSENYTMLAETQAELSQKLSNAYSIIHDSNFILDNFEKKLTNQKIYSFSRILLKKKFEFLLNSFRIWHKVALQVHKLNRKQKIKRFLCMLYKKNKALCGQSMVYWKYFTNNTKKQKKQQKITRIIKRHQREYLKNAIKSWVNVVYYEKISEMIELEKLDMFAYRVTRILYECQRIKLRMYVKKWTESIKKRKNTEKALKKLVTLIIHKTSIITQKTLIKIKMNSLSHNKMTKLLGKILRNLNIKILNSKIFCFQKLQEQAYKKSLKIAQEDCKELCKLADFSQVLIRQNENDIKFKTRALAIQKKLISSRLYKLKTLEKTRIIFLVWVKKSQSRKQAVMFLYNLSNKYSLRIGLYYFRTNKVTNLSYLEHSYVEKVPDSVEFEISDPSISIINIQKPLPYDYMAKVKHLASTLKSFLNSRFNLIFNIYRTGSPEFMHYLCQLSVENTSILTFAPRSTIKQTEKIVAGLFKLFTVTFFKKSIKIAFVHWKYLLYNNNKSMNSSVVNEILSEFSETKLKLQQREEMIKKLLRENMNLAYKVENAKVRAQGLAKITEMESNLNKENISENRRK